MVSKGEYLRGRERYRFVLHPVPRRTITQRTDAQAKALRTALQMLGDLCGFGITYFDFDGAGYVRTATEVPSDNSALMRNIRRHEHVLERRSQGYAAP